MVPFCPPIVIKMNDFRNTNTPPQNPCRSRLHAIAVKIQQNDHEHCSSISLIIWERDTWGSTNNALWNDHLIKNVEESFNHPQGPLFLLRVPVDATSFNKRTSTEDIKQALPPTQPGEHAPRSRPDFRILRGWSAKVQAFSREVVGIFSRLTLNSGNLFSPPCIPVSFGAVVYLLEKFICQLKHFHYNHTVKAIQLYHTSSPFFSSCRRFGWYYHFLHPARANRSTSKCRYFNSYNNMLIRYNAVWGTAVIVTTITVEVWK